MAVQFYLTDAGRNAVLNAENLNITISLSEIGVGSGKYSAATTAAGRTSLLNQLARYPLNGGTVEATSKTLRLISSIESQITADAYEVGLFTDNGVLFALAATTSDDPLLRLVTNITSIVTFGLTLADIDLTNVQISIDPNTPVSVALMNQHLAHVDPHPQYLKAIDFNANLSILAQAIWHVGSWHGTDSLSYNPATALIPFFGYETTWWLRPHAPYGVSTTGAAVKQNVPIAGTTSSLASTTRIWQRLTDGASPPAYQLTASQTTVDEGEQITFTLETNGIPQGTPVNWNITGIQSADITPNQLSGQFIVGSDGNATKTITIVADEVTEGTEVLRLALTYETSVYVDVTINDSSVQIEQVVYISNNSNDVNLLSLFTAEYGAPTAETIARFVIQNDIQVIASSINSFAIQSGNWPSGSTRSIDNHGYAMGRGGKGGSGGYWNSDSGGGHNAATAGQDGGTAIKAETGSALIINNYSIIAGGGGGGGAGGLVPSTSDGPKRVSAPGGGGAAFGEGGDAPNSKYEQFNGVLPSSAGLLTGSAGGIRPHVLYVGGPNDGQVAGAGGSGGAGGNAGQNGTAGNNDYEGADGDYPLDPMLATAGGLSGYIYEGSVTINDISGGQSLGRIP